jgi:hypothetical protein
MYPTSFKVALVPFKEDASSFIASGPSGSPLPEDILDKVSTASGLALRASPCSDPRTMSSSPFSIAKSPESSPLSAESSSPVAFSGEFALVHPRFNLLHDRSFVLKKRVECGELMSDIEASEFFIRGPKLSLPPRIGIIRALLPIYQKYETPTGFKSKIAFTLTEKKCAFMSRPSPEANLIQILFRQRFSVLHALKQLLIDAQNEAIPSYEMICRLSTYQAHLKFEHEAFLDYFDSIKALLGDVKCLLRSHNLTPKVFNEIQRNTHLLANTYVNQLIENLPTMLKDSEELTIDIAQKAVDAKPSNFKRIEDLLRTIKLAPASKAIHLEEIRSTIKTATSRFISQREPLNMIQIAYLEEIFKHFNAIYRKPKKETITAYDLEILKANAFTGTGMASLTTLEVLKYLNK